MVKNPNILFIIVDALRARSLSCYGNPQRVSPYIDKMARENVLFENAYSCSNGTDPSFTTIFSGLYPITHGVVMHGPSVTRRNVQSLNVIRPLFLPTILKAAGYTTLAIDWLDRWHVRGYDFYSGPIASRNLSSKGLGLSYRMLRHLTKYYPNLSIVMRLFLQKFYPPRLYDTADVVTEEAIRKVKDEKNHPFFLFLHYWDTHSPYSAPTKLASQFRDNVNKNDKKLGFLRESLIRDTIARYNGAISFIDQNIHRLMDALTELGLVDDTLFIFTSDHGESFVEHGIYFDHHGLYEPVVHVPLIIGHPKLLPQGERIVNLVGHVDLMPTILDILGINLRADFDGESLLPLLNEENVQTRDAAYMVCSNAENGKIAIRTNKYKYIYSRSKEGAICKLCGHVHGDFEELFHLKDDPEEAYNLIDEHIYVRQKLRKKLVAWEKQLRQRREKKKIKRKIARLQRGKSVSRK